MPPKTERLQQEASAQRARAAALQYLATTGAGPSQKEIAQQQKEREKWTNERTQTVQQRLAHLQPAAATTHSGAPMRDNTLAAMAAHRARMMLQGGGGGANVDGGPTRGNGAYDALSSSDRRSSAGGVGASDDSALPDGWKPAVDPTSGETYYWNETTKETSWDRPRGKKVVGGKTDPTDEDGEALEDGWEEVEDSESGQKYYWHQESNETTWTKPVKKTVSLEQAREAKSRLDAILKMCGPSKKSVVQQPKKQQPPNRESNTSVTRKRDGEDGAEDATSSKKVRVSN